MSLWLILALMTGLAALAMLWPLSRSGERANSHADNDIAVYKDQLAEIDRDLASGLIAGAEAQAARIEISRRLIGADEKARMQVQHAAGTPSDPGRMQAGALRRRRVAAVCILVLTPLAGLGLYHRLGSPDLPDQPLAVRLAKPAGEATPDELVSRVETVLASNPEDGHGWDLLAPVYLKQKRWDDARRAYFNAMRLLGATALRESGFGEASVAAADGMVTADARAAFERALRLDPRDDRARYYLGRASEQDGNPAAAVAQWQAIIDSNPSPSAVAFLRGEIARLDARQQAPSAQSGQKELPGPDAARIAEAQAMTAPERAQMIEGMVTSLATRLKDNGGTVQEWERLINAYHVLGRENEARAALAQARKAYAASPEAVTAFDNLGKALGL